MKRLLLLSVLLLTGVSCGGPTVLTAQTLPATRTLTWTASPAAEAVTSYTVRMDGTVIGNPTTPSQVIVFTMVGTHTLTVTATNAWGTSAPGTLVVDLRAPAAPGTLRIMP